MINFYKYQGAGNDFVLIDNRQKTFVGDKKKLAVKLCNRKYGIGSDGLIFIEQDAEADFLMDFYNPDGSQSFCGNGSRCAVKFAFDLNVFETNKISFRAIDGVHKAEILSNVIEIQMNDVLSFDQIDKDYFLNTGSPHYVSFIKDINRFGLLDFGRSIRYSDNFKPSGTNVNVVEIIDDNKIAVRTYERGVEDETLACGTGVTACALSLGLLNESVGFNDIDVKAKGGKLSVRFNMSKERQFTNITLTGPAEYVFKGTVDV